MRQELTGIKDLDNIIYEYKDGIEKYEKEEREKTKQRYKKVLESLNFSKRGYSNFMFQTNSTELMEYANDIFYHSIWRPKIKDGIVVEEEGRELYEDDIVYLYPKYPHKEDTDDSNEEQILLDELERYNAERS